MSPEQRIGPSCTGRWRWTGSARAASTWRVDATVGGMRRARRATSGGPGGTLAAVRVRAGRGATGAWSTARGHLQARVLQTCVVSLDEFEAAVDEIFSLRFVPEGTETDDPDPESEDEMPYSGDVLDLGEAAAEQLALALDPYPRKPDAELPAAERRRARRIRSPVWRHCGGPAEMPGVPPSASAASRSLAGGHTLC